MARDTAERVELTSTVLLALAAVAIAWTSYQGNRWNVEYRIASGHCNTRPLCTAPAQSLSQVQTQIDVTTFTQWVDAHAQTDGELARFYSKRFRKEFKPAFVSWLKTEPLTNPNAPLTPFAMPEYRTAASAEAEQLDAETELSSAAGRRDLERQSDYLLCVVLFAVSLFFAGMSTKLRDLRLRVALLGVGFVLFGGTLIWLATFPVSISV